MDPEAHPPPGPVRCLGEPRHARTRAALQAAGIKRVPLVVSAEREARLEPGRKHVVEQGSLSERLFGKGELASTLDRAFKHMGIAEHEIAEAMERHPDKASLINSQFVILATPEVLQGKDDEIYKWHVYELLERVATRQSLKPATKAEVMVHLANMSLRAPLRREWAVVYERLFNELFPQEFMEMFGKKSLRGEAWPGQYQEYIAKLQHQFRDENRVLKPVKVMTKVTAATKPASARSASRTKSLLDFFK